MQDDPQLPVDPFGRTGTVITGWNALVDHLRSQWPDLTLQDVYTASPDRANTVVIMEPGGVITSAPNLVINTDLTIDPTCLNLRGIADNCADRLPVPLASEGYPQVGV